MSVVAVDTLIDVDALVPDGIEPIEQYRVWNWNGNNLVSLNNTPWVPQKALSASCEGVHERWEYVLVRGAGWGLDVLRERAQERKAMEDRLFTSSTYYFGPPTFFPPVPSVEPPPGHGYELRPIRHDAPAESCSCGIYAAASETHDYSNQGTVYGKVKMWGKIVPGEKGVRAEYAYPSELHVPPILADDPGILAYGVPVIVDVPSLVKPAVVKAVGGRSSLRIAIALNVSAGALNLSLVGLHAFHWL